jgi:predicted nucleic acid-binding protein
LSIGATPYLDTNIFLNVIYKESGFQEASVRLLRAIQNGGVSGSTSVITFLEMALDMEATSLEAKELQSALSAVEDIQFLRIAELSLEMARNAAKYVLKDRLTIHDAYHLATALNLGASCFVTRDESLAKKIKKYIRAVKPEELIQETPEKFKKDSLE